MKIETVANVPHTNKLKAPADENSGVKGYSAIVKMREGTSAGIQLPRNSNKEMVQGFAEWYFKQGKVYENTSSYKQAISAYEKAYSIEPDIGKSKSIDQLRSKTYKN